MKKFLVLIMIASMGLSFSTFAADVTESFDTFDFPPPYWTTYRGENGLGTIYDWSVSSEYYSPDYNAKIHWDNITNPDTAQDWLVTPLITIGTGSQLTYYQKQEALTDYGSKFYILVSTETSNTYSDFNVVHQYTETDFSTTYSSETIDLSAYAGQNIYIAFMMANDFGDTWYIDDVSITNAALDTISMPKDYNMTTGTIIADNGFFYDYGGSSDSYINNLDDTLTFFPATSGNKLEFVFSEFSIEQGLTSDCDFDVLEVYDGASVSATLIGRYCNGSPIEDTLTATNADGALTFVFSSDYSTTSTGWSAEIFSIAGIPTAPVADFSANITSGTAPLSVTFTDESTGTPTSWAWDFDNDGNTDATTQNPSYSYTSAGTYSVKLTATNISGSNSITKTDYISVSAPANTTESESNDTYDVANTLDINGSLTGNVGVDTDDYDWFSITTPYDGKLQIVISPDVALNSAIEFYDTDGSSYLK